MGAGCGIGWQFSAARGLHALEPKRGAGQLVKPFQSEPTAIRPDVPVSPFARFRAYR
jgi:hypothetical protein